MSIKKFNPKRFNLKDYKSPTKINAKMSKGKVMVESLKHMNNGDILKKMIILNKTAVKDLESTNVYSEFRHKLNHYGVAKRLFVDSQAKKIGLAKNTEYDPICKQIALALGKPKMTPTFQGGMRIEKTAKKSKGMMAPKKVKAHKKVKVKK